MRHFTPYISKICILTLAVSFKNIQLKCCEVIIIDLGWKGLTLIYIWFVLFIWRPPRYTVDLNYNLYQSRYLWSDRRNRISMLYIWTIFNKIHISVTKIQLKSMKYKISNISSMKYFINSHVQELTEIYKSKCWNLFFFRKVFGIPRIIV